jgi:DNA repair protein REV1
MAKPLRSSASTDSSDFWGSDDPAFLEALGNMVLPGGENAGIPAPQPNAESLSRKRPRDEGDELKVETASHATLTNGLGDTENDPEVYGASRFGHFGEYMHRKRAKLQIQNANLEASQDIGGKSSIFNGLSIYVRIHSVATRTTRL